MKRSQMLKALHRKLKQWENCKIRMKETRELLEFIESKGMLPPEVKKDFGYGVYWINEWEPEDKK